MEISARSYPWLPASVVVGGLMGMFNWLTGQGGPEGGAFALGVAFGQTLVLWLGLLLTGLQRAGAGGVTGAFLVVWFLAFCGMVPEINTKGATPTGPVLSEQVERVRESVNSNTLDSVPLMDVAPAGTSDLEIAKEFSTRVLNAMLDDRNAYMAELRVIGWEQILDAQRLLADKGMASSRQILSQARAAGERNCVGYRDRYIGHARRVVAEMGISERASKELIDGFIRGLDKNAAGTDELCKIEFQIYDEVGGVLDVFAQDTGWYPENDQFLFTTDAYAQEFNRRLANIDEMSKRQLALQEESLKAGQDQLRSVGL